MRIFSGPSAIFLGNSALRLPAQVAQFDAYYKQPLIAAFVAYGPNDVAPPLGFVSFDDSNDQPPPIAFYSVLQNPFAPPPVGFCLTEDFP